MVPSVLARQCFFIFGTRQITTKGCAERRIFILPPPAQPARQRRRSSLHPNKNIFDKMKMLVTLSYQPTTRCVCKHDSWLCYHAVGCSWCGDVIWPCDKMWSGLMFVCKHSVITWYMQRLDRADAFSSLYLACHVYRWREVLYYLFCRFCRLCCVSGKLIYTLFWYNGVFLFVKPNMYSFFNNDYLTNFVQIINWIKIKICIYTLLHKPRFKSTSK